MVEGSSEPTVTVQWDALKDVQGKAGKAMVGKQRLLLSLWNKDKVGAWRLDVNIGVSWFDEDEDDMEEEVGGAVSEILDGGEANSDDMSQGLSSSESDFSSDGSED